MTIRSKLEKVKRHRWHVSSTRKTINGKTRKPNRLAQISMEKQENDERRKQNCSLGKPRNKRNSIKNQQIH